MSAVRGLLAFTFSVAATACSEPELAPISFSFEAPAALDFGDVAVGLSKQLELPIKNTSSLAIEIASLEESGAFTGERHLFRVDGEVSAIAPGDTAVVAVLFAVYGEMSEPVEATLSIVTDFETKEVKLSGRGVAAYRVEPSTLEFGRVALNTSKSLDITITSLLDAPLEVVAGPLDHLGGEEVFHVEPLAEPLPPHGAIVLPVVYTPRTRSSLEDRARLPFSHCFERTLCETDVELRGRVEEELVCDPPALDFGALVAGTNVSKAVICTVVASRDVIIERVTSPSNDLAVSTDLALPARLHTGQQIRLAMEYAPLSFSLAGAVSVDASFADTGAPIPPVAIPVEGELAEPSLEVTPTRLDFGDVSVGTTYALELSLINTGDTELVVTLAVDGATDEYFVAPNAVAIPSGTTQIAVIELTPLREGAISGDLVIDSVNYAGAVHVPLTGAGVTLAPCEYVLEPLVVDFGNVDVGLSTTLPVRIENIGSDDCLVRGFQTNAGRFEIESAPADQRLRPGEAARVLFTYTPDAGDRDTSSFTFYVSDPRNSQPRVSLAGNGEHDVPIVYPDLLDFGPVVDTCGANRTVRIHNGRASARTITEIELDPSSSAGLSITSRPQLPLVLEYGDSAEVSIHYVAGGAAQATGVLRFREDAFNTYVAGVLAKPVGDANAAVIEERFVQHEDSATDVLFVLDTSCSTAVRAQIADAFLSFAGAADDENIDYRLAFVDMTYETEAPFACVRQEMLPPGYDNGRCGYFFAPADDTDWKIITRDDVPSPEDAFRAAMQIGESGFPLEWMLENGRSALRAPLTLGWNAGFLRRDATLAMIVMTNEEEQSIGGVDMHTDALLRIKGAAQKNRASLHALVGTESGCSGPFGNAIGGVRLGEAARKTGGSVEDYCSSALSDPMAAFGSKIFGHRDAFLLENSPEPMTLEILVDGVRLPESSMSSGINWTYDDEVRAVKFAPAVIPERNAEIVARYRTQCGLGN